MQSLNVKAHPERSTWNHSLGSCFTTFSCLCGSARGRQRSCHLRIKKKKYELREEASDADAGGKRKQKKWWNYQAHSNMDNSFPQVWLPRCSGEIRPADTFSSAKTPLVIHIKTEGRAAEVEKEKSHWCGTNSFGAFPFFFISLKQTQGHFDGK